MGNLTIAFLGDIVGKPGRQVVHQQLPLLRADHQPDLIIANAENARSGSGLSRTIYEKLRQDGIDAVTLGDHVYRESSILDTLQRPDEPIARPANLSPSAVGKPFVRLAPTDERPQPVVLITVLGRIFFPTPANDPFQCVDEILAQLGDPNSIVIVEAHMEATSEKIALAHHLDGRVAAVLGTHTHVPTADARVLPGGTAFITDLGMCGPYHSVIGRDVEPVLRHMTTAMHTKFTVATEDVRLCGAILQIDGSTRSARSIERTEYRADPKQPPFTSM